MSIMRIFKKKDKRKEILVKLDNYIMEVAVASNSTYIESKPLMKDESVISFLHMATYMRDFLSKIEFLRNSHSGVLDLNDKLEREMECTTKLELELDRLKKSVVQLMREDESYVKCLPDYLDYMIKDSSKCEGKPLDCLLSRVRKEHDNVKLETPEMIDVNNVAMKCLGYINEISNLYSAI
ncbi:hypothetical protein UT300012_21730 [Paraclostridium bifermentans]